jgi:hypothetical protein
MWQQSVQKMQSQFHKNMLLIILTSHDLLNAMKLLYAPLMLKFLSWFGKNKAKTKMSSVETFSVKIFKTEVKIMEQGYIRFWKYFFMGIEGDSFS